jgi:hypothetical protein
MYEYGFLHPSVSGIRHHCEATTSRVLGHFCRHSFVAKCRHYYVQMKIFKLKFSLLSTLELSCLRELSNIDGKTSSTDEVQTTRGISYSRG